MKIVKRNGEVTNVFLDKIVTRLTVLCGDDIDKKYVDPTVLATKVIHGLQNMMKTSELDVLAAEQAASQITEHPDFDKLAARITVSNLHKCTRNCREFSRVTEELRNAVHPSTGESAPVVGEEYYKTVMRHAERLDKAIDYKRDFSYTYFGIKTLEYSYLLRIGDEIVERPQHMLMRVAVGIHGEDIDSAIETYDLMSRHVFTHASPTMFNAGTVVPQLSSCFLVGLQKDSFGGVMDTLKDAAMILETAGGIGLHIHDMRGKGNTISSSRVMPLMKIFNETARCVSQGGNRRKGAISYYVEPWHIDIKDIIECRKNAGNEDLRTRDLFPALWIPDEFMRRAEEKKEWTLMCPSECPGLSDVYGEEFDKLYKEYEKAGKGRRTINARELWNFIVYTKIETGTPFICFKDHVNNKSNHSNIGVIKSSNLCTEIVQYSDAKQTAVCNLASVAVNKLIGITPEPYFDFQELKRVIKVMVRNLNKIIDVNYYPTEKARFSNMKTRPMGIGVQGLADAFIKLRISFDSEDAQLLNKRIFETIYYGALEASCELAEDEGKTYDYYEGSPISEGILQFDMWEKNGYGEQVKKYMTEESIQDWQILREKIKKHGVRNSMLVAQMPTASTAHILGNAESIEPYTSNIFNRNVLPGAFQVVNESLVRDLVKADLWTDAIKNKIIADGGSIKNISAISSSTRDLYKTSWEIPQRMIINMAADRGMFVDQAQSLNLYVAEPSYKTVNAMYFYAWQKGVKTTYYLRTKGAAKAVQFTVDKTKLKQLEMEEEEEEEEKKKNKEEEEEEAAKPVCSLENKDACVMCSG
uniref:Ribonucleoside-diphosphate reductase n=1 Tax=Metopaulias depressus WSSV-like virus TaxID=1675544 RepID=A0A0K0VL63_9VIRU|nr:wsv172-like protein [Metopaulias depressus WSSV-like virus]